MTSQVNPGIQHQFPLVIPTQSGGPTAKLAVRGPGGQLVQQWLIKGKKYTLGSASDCPLRCDLPGIAPYHALIVLGARQTFVRALAPRLTREGTPVTEILLVGDQGQFEIAGHQFEMLRGDIQPADTPAAKKRMSFALARPLATQRTAPSVVTNDPNSRSSLRPLAESSPDRTTSQWVSELVREAVAPLEQRLSEVVGPINELQNEARARRKSRSRKTAARLAFSQNEREQTVASTIEERINELSDVRESPTIDNDIAEELRTQIETVTVRQSAAMEVITERISDVNQQLSTIERLVNSEQQDASSIPADMSSQLDVQNASIEQLQQGFVAVTDALRELNESRQKTEENEREWKAGVQDKLELLEKSIGDLHQKSRETAHILSADELQRYSEQLAQSQSVLAASVQENDLDLSNLSATDEQCVVQQPDWSPDTQQPPQIDIQSYADPAWFTGLSATSPVGNDQFEVTDEVPISPDKTDLPEGTAGLASGSTVAPTPAPEDELAPESELRELIATQNQIAAEDGLAGSPTSQQEDATYQSPIDPWTLEATGQLDSEFAEPPAADPFGAQNTSPEAEAPQTTFPAPQSASIPCASSKLAQPQASTPAFEEKLEPDAPAAFPVEAMLEEANNQEHTDQNESAAELFGFAAGNVSASSGEFASQGLADELVSDAETGRDWSTNFAAGPDHEIEQPNAQRSASELDLQSPESAEPDLDQFPTLDAFAQQETPEQIAEEGIGVPQLQEEAVASLPTWWDEEPEAETNASESNNNQESEVATADITNPVAANTADEATQEPTPISEVEPDVVENLLPVVQSTQIDHLALLESTVPSDFVGEESTEFRFTDVQEESQMVGLESKVASNDVTEAARPDVEEEDFFGLGQYTPENDADTANDGGASELATNDAVAHDAATALPTRLPDAVDSPESTELPEAVERGEVEDANPNNFLERFLDTEDSANQPSLAVEKPVVEALESPSSEDELGLDDRLDASLSNAELAVESEFAEHLPIPANPTTIPEIDDEPLNAQSASVESTESNEAASGEDEEESVEAYMQRLLARMRGDDEPQAPAKKVPSESQATPSAPTAKASELESANESRTTQAPTTTSAPAKAPASTIGAPVAWVDELELSTPQGNSASDASNDNHEASGLSAEQIAVLNQKEQIAASKRSSAQSADQLAAMRELANNSARTAISRSNRRRIITAFSMKAGVALTGAIVAVILLAINGLNLNIGLIATCAALLVAAIWGYDCLATLRQFSAPAPAKARPDATTDIEAEIATETETNDSERTA